VTFQECASRALGKFRDFVVEKIPLGVMALQRAVNQIAGDHAMVIGRLHVHRHVAGRVPRCGFKIQVVIEHKICRHQFATACFHHGQDIFGKHRIALFTRPALGVGVFVFRE
jgi:hypothetical protein